MRAAVNRRLINDLYQTSRITLTKLTKHASAGSDRSNFKSKCIAFHQFESQKSARAFHLHSALLSELVEFKLADIGEGINEVVVKEWYVKVGDRVRQFDSICEVQSDKASVTITSRFDGTITKLFYEPEQMALVGKPLVQLQVETVGKMVDELNDHDTPATTTSNSIPVTANESTNESVESGGSACVPASSFSASSATSQSNNGSSNQSLFEPSSSSSLNLTAGGDKVLTTPAVRRLATEHNVNLQDVQPTGKDGRVLKEDVLRHLEQLQPQSQNGTNCSASAATRITNKEPASPTVVRTSTTARTVRTGSTLSGKASLPALLESDQVHRLKGVQKAMAKSMTAALRIPHFGLSDELNLSKLVKLRAQLKKQVEQRGVHLSYLPFFVKAASLALRQYPMLNATFDAENEQLVYRASHNIGVAVDSPSGLVVPNVKNVQNLSILEIAQQLNHLTGLAANGQLSNNDMTGGTFTLSNIGSIGGLFGIPVILPPEVAIGAIGRIQEKPRFDEKDNFTKAQVLTVVWCADHRVIDGATMTRFNNVWKSYLENPLLMITELK